MSTETELVRIDQEKIRISQGVLEKNYQTLGYFALSCAILTIEYSKQRKNTMKNQWRGPNE